VDRRDDALETLHAAMAAAHLAPTWKYVSEFVPAAPRVTYRPYLWKWHDVLPHLRRAGELITPERGAERRSMEHVNPDLAPAFATSHTLATAFQLVRPGEVAPAHRHAPAAVRFTLDSPGGHVYTTVEGERLPMEEHDLLLTPSGTWHEHANETSQDVIWLDVLDFPLVNLLQACWFEPHPDERQPVSAPADAAPPKRYPWREMRVRLEALRDGAGSPWDGVMLEYVPPGTAGPTLPTMSCRVQLLRPEERTRAHRATSSTVYYVMAGAGTSVIAGTPFDWARGDVFVVPPWAWHEHANATSADALLFSATDEPVMRGLGLYREEGR
jgi:gentisate 1,2-dioxygenase